MHSLPKVCALFHITNTTLRRWYRRAHIIPHVDPDDNRRRYLDNDQLLKLAQLHCRVLIINREDVRIVEILQWEARIAKLEKNINDNTAYSL